MMITENQNCYKTTKTSLHWGAIFGGAFVAVGIGFLLNIFTKGIGLSAYTASSTGAPIIAIGGVLGLLIGVIVAMGAGGFVTGHLSRFYHCYCHGGVIYGFITWSLALMLSALLIMPMSHYVSFYEKNLSPAFASTKTIEDSHVAVTEQKVSPQKAADLKLSWINGILFILLFIGAFSSCVGACYGMRCKKEEELHSHPQRNL